jgi:hypothetical protein
MEIVYSMKNGKFGTNRTIIPLASLQVSKYSGSYALKTGVKGHISERTLRSLISAFMQLQMLGIVIDAATSQPARPLSDFVHSPRLPIREVYLTRTLINAVWFARNYLNIMLLFSLFFSVFWPLLLVVLAAAGCVHWQKRRGSKLSLAAAKLFQLLASLFVWYTYGIMVVIFTCLVPSCLVAAHALFTPYTDEASSHYERLLTSEGIEAPAPRSPTILFEGKDKMFEEAVNEERKRQQEPKKPDSPHTLKLSISKARTAATSGPKKTGLHPGITPVSSSLPVNAVRARP